MFYYNSQGAPISIINRRPRNLSGGGYVHGHPNDPHKHEDTIASLLEYGSLVIPTVIMESGIMDGYKGPLLGPKTKKKRELAPVVIMTGEMIVDKLHAPAVERYLKKHGITLPLPK